MKKDFLLRECVSLLLDLSGNIDNKQLSNKAAHLHNLISKELKETEELEDRVELKLLEVENFSDAEKLIELSKFFNELEPEEHEIDSWLDLTNIISRLSVELH